MTYIDLHHRLQAILNEFGRYQESGILGGGGGGGGDQSGGISDGLLLYSWYHGAEGSQKKKEEGPVEKYAEGARVPGPHEEPDLPVEVCSLPHSCGDENNSLTSE